jgi:RNA polymerase sigma-70 factor (ECF subfamily)
MNEFPLTRASLLVRLRDPRDGSAWKEFVDVYTPVVYGYARKQGLQDADASDLAQEVLVAVAGAVGRLEYDPARGAFRNWLFTIVRNKLSHWRTGQNRLRGSGDTQTHILLEQRPAEEGEDPQWQAEWEQQVFAWACQQARGTVADITWQAFWRTAVEGRPGKDVATELGIPIASVYQARSRVLARLKELVQSVQEP